MQALSFQKPFMNFENFVGNFKKFSMEKFDANFMPWKKFWIKVFAYKFDNEFPELCNESFDKNFHEKKFYLIINFVSWIIFSRNLGLFEFLEHAFVSFSRFDYKFSAYENSDTSLVSFSQKFEKFDTISGTPSPSHSVLIWEFIRNLS